MELCSWKPCGPSSNSPFVVFSLQPRCAIITQLQKNTLCWILRGCSSRGPHGGREVKLKSVCASSKCPHFSLIFSKTWSKPFSLNMLSKVPELSKVCLQHYQLRVTWTVHPPLAYREVIIVTRPKGVLLPLTTLSFSFFLTFTWKSSNIYKLKYNKPEVSITNFKNYYLLIISCHLNSINFFPILHIILKKNQTWLTLPLNISVYIPRREYLFKKITTIFSSSL